MAAKAGRKPRRTAVTYVRTWSRQSFGKADCSRHCVCKQKSLEIAATVCSDGEVYKCCYKDLVQYFPKVQDAAFLSAVYTNTLEYMKLWGVQQVR